MQGDMNNKDSNKLVAFMAVSAIIMLVSMILFFCYSCTNVVMTHTEGGASDTVEDAQHVNPNVSPSLNIPENPVINALKK